jgi:two-component system, LytTR family, response regulator
VSALRVLIVDDEPPAREGLRAMLEAEPDVEVVGDCGNGRDAGERIRALSPDVVFLDIRMPEKDGFAVVEDLAPGGGPAIVFVTAFDEHALRAFEVHALDYLLKPFGERRLREALVRAREHLRRGTTAVLTREILRVLGERSAPAASDRIAVRGEDRIHLLAQDDFDWAQAADERVEVHVRGRRQVLRETFADLVARLDPARFARIHRSVIVNLERVRELQPFFRGDYVVLLEDGTRLRLSRTYREELGKRIGHGL